MSPVLSKVKGSATIDCGQVVTIKRANWIARHPFISLTTLLLLALVLSLFVGRYPQPYWMSPALLQENELARQLVFNLRLPRILTAVLLGMALAGAGAVMQMIFRNPLVEPGFLGVSQGAGFGA
ncbi:MAG: iron ABC transporter permease, partial [Anaerolineales bacterium]|nr:iron ABC transporter permease [Anaerolineales bacterium]